MANDSLLPSSQLSMMMSMTMRWMK